MRKISVLMSVYREPPEWIRLCIASVLEQSYQNFEFIIILDNPESETHRKLLEAYQKKDRRIQVLVNDQNIGLTASLNRGLSKITGEFVVRLDADEINHLKRFEEQLKFLDQHPDISLVGTRAVRINEEGNYLYHTQVYSENPEKIRRLLQYKDYFLHSSWMFRTEILNKLVSYHHIPHAEDYDFLCRLSLYGYQLAIMPDYLLKSRIYSGGISRSNAYEQNAVRDMIRKEYTKAIRLGSCSSYNPQPDKLKKKLNVRQRKRYHKAFQMYNQGIELIKQKKRIKGANCILKSCLLDYRMAVEIYLVMMSRRILKSA